MIASQIQKMIVTPTQATNWLQSNKQNRNVRNYWVEQLTNQIKSGNWILTHQGIAISKSGVLIDGQHRLMAIQKANIPVEMFVCFDADESIFKAIDSGIKRSMSDLTKLNKLDAEVATRVCKILFYGQGITPDRVLSIGNTGFIQTHSKLLDVCSARLKYYGSVNVRASACLAVALGSSFDYVSKIYTDLNRMEVKNLPNLAAALVKQVASNSIQANNHGDCLARTLKVFTETNKNSVRLYVSEQEIKETYEKFKFVFLNQYNIGEPNGYQS